MTIKLGCLGCKVPWGSEGAEGQCSRCKRCLQCCSISSLKYTCAWRDAKKTPDQQLRSAAAYERWAADPRMLAHNRRIT
jgi:hypothetical protein